MGAVSFTTPTFCERNMADAFKAARQDAQYWYGHGGYSGTIAEKTAFFEAKVPPRVKARQFAEVLIEAVREHRESYWNQDRKAPLGNWYQLVKWVGEQQAIRLIDIYDDKWGPAIGIQLTDSEADPIRPKTPTGRNKPGYGACLFIGTASM